jgi:hypothetical protein
MKSGPGDPELLTELITRVRLARLSQFTRPIGSFTIHDLAIVLMENHSL